MDVNSPHLGAVTGQSAPWTIGGLLDWTARYLAKKGAEFPRLDAEVLLAHALNCKRIDLYTRYTDPTTDEQRASYRDLVRRRVEGCPVAYLVGRKEFYSLSFEVGPEVLIPRAESECVVMECLRLARDLKEPTLLDIGTGSGNLAVTVAHRHPGARVTAVDISPPALELAQRNARNHGVFDRIRFLQGDLFAPLDPGEKFDFVVSNPPYIAREDIPSLSVGVRDYEPRLALDGGAGGYVVFDRLIETAGGHLNRGGHLIVEIGVPQEKPARERIGAIVGYQLGSTILDGSRHPRVLCARWLPD